MVGAAAVRKQLLKALEKDNWIEFKNAAAATGFLVAIADKAHQDAALPSRWRAFLDQVGPHNLQLSTHMPSNCSKQQGTPITMMYMYLTDPEVITGFGHDDGCSGRRAPPGPGIARSRTREAPGSVPHTVQVAPRRCSGGRCPARANHLQDERCVSVSASI